MIFTKTFFFSIAHKKNKYGCFYLLFLPPCTTINLRLKIHLGKGYFGQTDPPSMLYFRRLRPFLQGRLPYWIPTTWVEKITFCSSHQSENDRQMIYPLAYLRGETNSSTTVIFSFFADIFESKIDTAKV